MSIEDLKLELKKHIIKELNLLDIEPEDIIDEEPLFVEGLGLDSIDSLEDFEDRVLSGRVSGFSEFKSYIQGDYTYDKAMVKAVLESTSVSGRTELENMEIQVDLPDIIERGTATILVDTDGIAVTFNKSFWITPELTVTVKGGDNTVALIPEITQQSSAGFTVKLRNADTGAYAIGTLSWTAHGY